ncbi:hypothetical protein HDE_03838 [Halotydeus destructor]|nr:hypothetical protein HDE_03838 [Halotydeus destructor]
MIGALAIKRRRKGQLAAIVPGPKSPHCGFVYILGGVAFVTGIILMLPAIFAGASTLWIVAGSLMGSGLLLVFVGCLLTKDIPEEPSGSAKAILSPDNKTVALLIPSNLVESVSNATSNLSHDHLQVPVVDNVQEQPSSSYKYEMSYSNLPQVST